MSKVSGYREWIVEQPLGAERSWDDRLTVSNAQCPLWLYAD
jgi:hypothetical protein